MITDKEFKAILIKKLSGIFIYSILSLIGILILSAFISWSMFPIYLTIPLWIVILIVIFSDRKQIIDLLKKSKVKITTIAIPTKDLVKITCTCGQEIYFCKNEKKIKILNEEFAEA